jgi:hypothetical protein
VRWCESILYYRAAPRKEIAPMSQDATMPTATPAATRELIDAMLGYRATEPAPFTRFLWWCAGVDAQILKFCTTAEHIRYQGIGAFVLFTGLLAFLSGGYAIFTVFRPLDPNASILGPAIGGLAFGVFWATMIFNLDRYIVSSTGKGDGKETISLSELVNAAPRLLMASLIGLVMSAPIELRLFEREINVELKRQEISTMADYERRDSIAFSARAHTLDSLTLSLERRIDTASMLTRQSYDAMTAEGDGLAGTGRAGAGPRYAGKKARFEELTAAEARLRAALKPGLDSLRLEQRSLRDTLSAHRVENLRTARQIGGLIDRLRIADDKGGMSIWVIRFLLLVLETIPVLTKLMHRTGPYDILSDHMKVMIPARLGITTETHTGVRDGKLVSRVTDAHPVADFVLRGAEHEIATRSRAAAGGNGTADSTS